MANPKHTIHVGIAVVGLADGAIMAVATDGDAFDLGLATGGTTGVGYWLGASAQRRHGLMRKFRKTQEPRHRTS